jgi:hypothetical protein
MSTPESAFGFCSPDSDINGFLFISDLPNSSLEAVRPFVEFAFDSAAGGRPSSSASALRPSRIIAGDSSLTGQVSIGENGEEPFQVSLFSLRQSCDTPGLFGLTSSRVKSSAPAPIIRSLLKTLNGIDIKITDETVVYSAELHPEFGFWFLSVKNSDFCNSSEHQI